MPIAHAIWPVVYDIVSGRHDETTRSQEAGKGAHSCPDVKDRYGLQAIQPGEYKGILDGAFIVLPERLAVEFSAADLAVIPPTEGVNRGLNNVHRGCAATIL